MAGESGDREQAETRLPAATPLCDRSHLLHQFTGRAHSRLDDLDSVLTATMTDAERGETIAEAVRLQDRLAGMIATLVADDPTAADQLRERTNVTSATARRLARRSRALERHPEVHQALRGGEIHADQAEVITHVVDKLPDEVAHLAAEARAVMLELALDHDAKILKGMGNYLLHVVAPDQADELLARQLEKEEQEARRSCYLKTSKDGHGSTYGRFKIPDLHGHLLDTLLSAIANPQRKHPIERTARDLPEVKGEAFCQLLERVDPKALPRTGGTAVSVLVTLSLETLLGGLKAGSVPGTDLQLSPGEARRLAAKHGVIPAVLGAKSELLDLGRRRRLFGNAQRLALSLRQDGLCNIVGCDIPASWCDANHRTDWQLGGRTDLADGELLCPKHHTRHHQGRNLPRRT